MKFLYLYVFTLFFQVTYYSQINYSDQKKESAKVIRSADVFSDELHAELVNSIFPYWYGTPWDFNGYTNTPREGVIACGYFVSTTLKHIGFSLNRYDIAKMYSSDIVQVLCFDDYWTASSYDTFMKTMTQMENGIYIVGLSNHVGFIEQIDGRTYFIHSNYMSENGVEKELAEKSIALRSSTTYWLGNFSNNPKVKLAYLAKQELKK